MKSEQENVLEYAIRRAASIGIDARQLSTKGRLSLAKLFNAIDRCKKEHDEIIKQALKHQVNPTNLVPYGIPLSTINHSSILKQVVNFYQRQQQETTPAIPRKQYNNLLEETEQLRQWQKNSLKAELVIMELQEEIKRLEKDNNHLTELYRRNKELEPFNEVLKQKRP